MRHAVRTLSLLLVVLLAPAAAAQFEAVVPAREALLQDDLFATARGAAIAHADLAASDGVGGLWSNPGADLRGDHDLELSVAHANDLAALSSADDVRLVAAGVSFVRRSVRLAFGVRDLSFTQRIRTAFDPVGTRFEYERRDVAAGLAVELSDALGLEGPLRWSAGLAGRARREDLGLNSETELRGAAFDLGTTVTWAAAGEGALRRVAAAVVFRNVFDGELDADDEPARPIPRALHAGVTAHGARRVRGFAVHGTLALALTHQLNDVDETDLHVGGELVLADLVVLRAGRHDVNYPSVLSYGVGLRFAVLGSARVGVAWSRQDVDTDLGDGTIDVVGVRGAATF